MSLGAFVTVLEFVGLYVFATSGALMAIHKGFDIVGIAILALLTALGGGDHSGPHHRRHAAVPAALLGVVTAVGGGVRRGSAA